MLKLYSQALDTLADATRFIQRGLAAVDGLCLTKEEQDQADDLLTAIYDAAQDFNQQMNEIADGYDAAQLEEMNSNG